MPNQSSEAGNGVKLGAASFGVAVFFALMFIMNAPAMLRSAENLAFDHPGRSACIALVKPVAAFSSFLHLDFVRSRAEGFERKYLE